MSKLNNNHYNVLLYSQRCTKQEAQEILLNHDYIIHFGRVYKIKCEEIGAGIYELSKDVERYRKENNPPVKNKLAEKFKSVLCDQDGNVCISGADKDRQVLKEAIRELEKLEDK